MTNKITNNGCYRRQARAIEPFTYLCGIKITDHSLTASAYNTTLITHIFLLLAVLLGLAVPAKAQYTGDISGSSTQLSDTGAISRTPFRARLAEQTHATDFCNASQANGSADATTCLQAATDAMCARAQPGGRLFVPPGRYRIDSTWTIKCSGIEIAGAGIGDRDVAGSGTTFIAANAGGSSPAILARVTSFGGKPSNVTFSYGFAFHDATVVGESGTLRTGPFLEMDWWQQASVNNVYFFGTCNAITVSGGVEIAISDVKADNYRSSCDVIALKGDAAAAYRKLDVVSFDRVVVGAAASGSCYAVTDRVQTVWWKNTVCETGGQALKASCPTMGSPYECPGFFTLYDFESEYFGNTNQKLIALTDLVDGFKMADSWLRGGQSTTGYSDNLIYIDNARFPSARALNLTITNSWMKFSGGSCVYVGAGRTSISGNHIYGCNQYNIGAYGVELLAPRSTVTGNTFCGADWLNDITWPMNGVRSYTGADYTAVSGNVFSGNENGQNNRCYNTYVDNSGGSHNLASGNVGP